MYCRTLILAIVISVLACLVSLLFEEVEDDEESIKEEISVKESINNIKVSFGIILKSSRLKSLMIYSGIMWGFMCLMSEYRTSILEDIGTSSQIIGIMSAIFGIVSGIASKNNYNLITNFEIIHYQ